MAEEKEEEQPQECSTLLPPSKFPRLSSDANAGGVTMASSSPLVLGLGLGLGAGTTGGPQKPAFTFMQLQELEHQALIYKYMVAGVPVPVHLVLPIWKSVAASSFGPHHFPSLMGLGSLCFDYRNSMEPEPGRCRRTDGKKWRCSRDVVPGQKYCERHVHRGRGRSRKPVEALGGATAGTYLSSGLTTGQAQPKENDNFNGGGLMPVSVPSAGLQLMSAAISGSAGGNSSSSSNNISPPRLGFSPTSVLQNAGVCKTGLI